MSLTWSSVLKRKVYFEELFFILVLAEAPDTPKKQKSANYKTYN
jgi:hypothetical protein